MGHRLLELERRVELLVKLQLNWQAVICPDPVDPGPLPSASSEKFKAWEKENLKKSVAVVKKELLVIGAMLEETHIQLRLCRASHRKQNVNIPDSLF